MVSEKKNRCPEMREDYVNFVPPSVTFASGAGGGGWIPKRYILHSVKSSTSSKSNTSLSTGRKEVKCIGNCCFLFKAYSELTKGA